VLLVFHLGLGQGGAAGGAPVHRLFAAVDGPAEKEAAVFFQDFGHVGVMHGQVGVGPVPQHPQALKFGPLDADELPGISPAAAPNLHLGQFQLLGLQLLVHLVFDGQPVAVPAGHIGAIKTHHLPGLDDNVFQNLV
jgi:hypothetical protein